MKLFDYSDFYAAFATHGFVTFVEDFRKLLEVATARPDGNFSGWQESFNQLPELKADLIDLSLPAVKIGAAEAIDGETRKKLKKHLLEMSPWRKGPFEVFGVYIDAEWRSDMKWARVEPHLAPLAGRRILDVGCGNGYYLLRMLGCGAAFVLGIDPSLLFLTQFAAMKKYAGNLQAFMLPVGIEVMPETQSFDTVFSMGVFYHRRSPFDFLRQLKMQLRPGGELVLETLVVEGDAETVLVPEDRYARMRNVWFLPSVRALEKWLLKAGFVDVRTVDECKTTIEEQRSSEWMKSESFRESLHPEHCGLTIEGLPSPLRAVLIGKRP